MNEVEVWHWIQIHWFLFLVIILSYLAFQAAKNLFCYKSLSFSLYGEERWDFSADTVTAVMERVVGMTGSHKTGRWQCWLEQQIFSADVYFQRMDQSWFSRSSSVI